MKIEFIPSTEDAKSFEKPKPAKSFIPKWYKSMKREVSGSKPISATSDVRVENTEIVSRPTLKTCVPVQDYMISGYMIPLWLELITERTDKGINFTWKNGDQDVIGSHSGFQIENSPLEKHLEGNTLYKLNSPWSIRTPKGYSCLFFSPFYHDTPFKILPGIVDTDTYHHPNFPFVYCGTGEKTLHQIGTPIVQLLPIKREPWLHEVIENPSLIREQYVKFHSMFLRAYKTLFHSKKDFR